MNKRLTSIIQWLLFINMGASIILAFYMMLAIGNMH